MRTLLRGQRAGTPRLLWWWRRSRVPSSVDFLFRCVTTCLAMCLRLTSVCRVGRVFLDRALDLSDAMAAAGEWGSMVWRCGERGDAGRVGRVTSEAEHC